MFIKKIKYSEAIDESISDSIKKNKNIYVVGAEMLYKAKAFGTVQKSYSKFPKQFISTPSMENGLCTILAGSAIEGLRPVFINNRCDFLFLAFDPIVNLIAKWKYMFNGNSGSCPIVIRAIIGRGWGQGPTHSQTLYNFLFGLKGIKIFMPALAQDAYNVIRYSLKANHPSIILENRQLYNETSEFYKNNANKEPISTLFFNNGKMLIISSAYTTVQALRVSKIIKKKFNINISILNIILVNPINDKNIIKLTKKYKNILILDSDSVNSNLSNYLFFIIKNNNKKANIKVIGNAKTPTPASEKLEKLYYLQTKDIYLNCLKMLKIKIYQDKINFTDVKNFDGPY
jgi:pyruvate/2-oxoglutarate/acetoin dehydrogenase E1 component